MTPQCMLQSSINRQARRHKAAAAWLGGGGLPQPLQTLRRAQSPHCEHLVSRLGARHEGDLPPLQPQQLCNIFCNGGIGLAIHGFGVHCHFQCLRA